VYAHLREHRFDERLEPRRDQQLQRRAVAGDAGVRGSVGPYLRRELDEEIWN
jgi:hypothetical protein